MICTLDIETLPTNIPTVIADIAESVNEKIGKEIAAIRAPGNYGAEAASKWLIEKGQPAIDALKEGAAKEIDQAVRKTALDGSFGRVCVVGLAIDDEPVQTFASDNDEVSVLLALNLALDKCLRELHTIQFCGHNIVQFDIRFLMQRYIVHGIKPSRVLMRVADSKPWDQAKVYDTMVQWAGTGGRISLDKLCRVLSIPTSKGDITGATVFDAVQAGRIHDVADYCAKDVEVTRRIYRRMNFEDAVIVQPAEQFEDIDA
jgi:hypothetical protein